MDRQLCPTAAGEHISSVLYLLSSIFYLPLLQRVSCGSANRRTRMCVSSAMKKLRHRSSTGRSASDPIAERRPDRKLLQLCRQVAETLNQVLSGECDDDILRSLYVTSVIPAPNAAQLLVVVVPALPDEILEPARVLERLSAQSGHLRHAVATSITRRRAPQLVFQFASNSDGPEGR
jgi:ribosome-binding factor A